MDVRPCTGGPEDGRPQLPKTHQHTTPPAVEQEVMAVQDLAKHGINQADIAKLQEVRCPPY